MLFDYFATQAMRTQRMFELGSCVTPIDHGDDRFIVIGKDAESVVLRHTWTREIKRDVADKYSRCSPPENQGLKKYEEHEEVCFRNAWYFSVARKVQRTSQAMFYDTYPEALQHADARSLIYAVTCSNRSVCIDRKAWDKYLQLWQSLPGVCHAPAQ